MIKTSPTRTTLIDLSTVAGKKEILLQAALKVCSPPEAGISLYRNLMCYTEDPCLLLQIQLIFSASESRCLKLDNWTSCLAFMQPFLQLHSILGCYGIKRSIKMHSRIVMNGGYLQQCIYIVTLQYNTVHTDLTCSVVKSMLSDFEVPQQGLLDHFSYRQVQMKLSDTNGNQH